MVNYTERHSSHPADAKSYDTQRLRDEFLVEQLFVADTAQLTISAFDRFIVGGVLPIAGAVELTSVDALKSEFFLQRRELGIVNIGGKGVVTIGDESYELEYKEALYLGKNDLNPIFSSLDSAEPAKFYLCSSPAHCNYPNRKIAREDAVVIELGSVEECNRRTLRKLIVNDVLPSCQLQMGMTELHTGSVWNTMPAHTHNRRMEAYCYFEIPEKHAVCHFMGEPTETRHIWMRGEQAVISPYWSIHSAAATHNYTFIWGMAGENLDYTDQDFVDNIDLR